MNKKLFIILMAITSISGYSQGTLDSGLIAYYPFNGNSLDSTSNGINLTNVGATLDADRKGIANKAYYFDGTTAYMHAVAAPALFSISSFSFSFWIKAASTQNTNCRLIAVTPGGSYFHKYFCWIETGGIDAFGVAALSTSGNYNFYDLSASNYSPSTWQHVVVSFHNNYTKFYIDGVLDKSTPKTGGIEAFSNNLVLQIAGAYHPSSPQALFKGSLDDIRIYKRELQLWEVKQLYNGTSVLSLSQNNQNKLIVYPNPAPDGIFNIQIDAENELSYEVTSMIGQKVKEGKVSNNQLDISDLPNGNYLVKIKNGDEVYFNKIVK